LGVMTFVAATYMHIQVATRFLSTSPAIYWALAYLGTNSARWRYWVTFYYLSYASVGVVLFTRFYPWT
jgi:phosphatidylinositol glycan class V